jgi:anti-sigma-K factor RskA
MLRVTDESIHDLAAGYVLDALDADERRSFETHLPECAACREQVGELASTAVALAYAAEGPLPPEELRERVLGAARAERGRVVSLRHRRWTPAGIAAVAAAAAIAVGLGLWATLGSEGTRAREPQTLALTGANGSLAVGRTGTAVLTVRQVRPAPAGKTYEIWVIPTGGKPAPAGLFGGSGRVTLERKVPAGATVAVTVERAGGTRTPTLPIRFSTQVPA